MQLNSSKRERQQAAGKVLDELLQITMDSDGRSAFEQMLQGHPKSKTDEIAALKEELEDLQAKLLDIVEFQKTREMNTPVYEFVDETIMNSEKVAAFADDFLNDGAEAKLIELFGRSSTVKKAKVLLKTSSTALKYANGTVEITQEFEGGVSRFEAALKVGGEELVVFASTNLARVLLVSLLGLNPATIAGGAVLASVYLLIDIGGEKIYNAAYDYISENLDDVLNEVSEIFKDDSLHANDEKLTIATPYEEMTIEDGLVTLQHLPVDEAVPSANVTMEQTAQKIAKKLPEESVKIIKIDLPEAKGLFRVENDNVYHLKGNAIHDAHVNEYRLGKDTIQVELDYQTGEKSVILSSENQPDIILENFDEKDYGITLPDSTPPNSNQTEAPKTLMSLDYLSENADALADGFTHEFKASDIIEIEKLEDIADSLDVSVSQLADSLSLKYEKMGLNKLSWVMDYEKLGQKLTADSKAKVDKAFEEIRKVADDFSDSVTDNLMSNATVSYLFNESENTLFEYSKFNGDLSSFVTKLDDKIEGIAKEEFYKISENIEGKVESYLLSKAPDVQNVIDTLIQNVSFLDTVETFIGEFDTVESKIETEVQKRIDKVKTDILGDGQIRDFVDKFSKYIDLNKGLNVEDVADAFFQDFKDQQLDSVMDTVFEKVGVDKLAGKFAGAAGVVKDVFNDIFSGGFKDLNNEEIADKLLETAVSAGLAYGAKLVGAAVGGPVGAFIAEVVTSLYGTEIYTSVDDTIKAVQRNITDTFKAIGELNVGALLDSGITFLENIIDINLKFVEDVVNKTWTIIFGKNAEKPQEAFTVQEKEDSTGQRLFILNENSQKLEARDWHDDDLFGLQEHISHDRLIGGNGKNIIMGESGEDFIDGQEHHDILIGGEGLDTILGGDGDDTINGDVEGSDHGHDDQLFAGDGKDIVNASGGNDTVWGMEGNDQILGGKGDDELYGGENEDKIDGGQGNDFIMGESGLDELFGASGHDTLNGGEGNDTLLGGQGNDVLKGGAGNDTLYGEADNDHLSGGAGNDKLYGGKGNDTLLGGEGLDTLVGGEDSDLFVLNNTENIESSQIIADFNPDEDELLVRTTDRNTTYQIRQTHEGSILQFSDGRNIYMLGKTADELENLKLHYEIREPAASDAAAYNHVQENFTFVYSIAAISNAPIQYIERTNPAESLYQYLSQDHALFTSLMPETNAHYGASRYWYKEVYKNLYLKTWLGKVKIGRKIESYDLQWDDEVKNPHLDNLFLGSQETQDIWVGAGNDTVYGIAGEDRIFGGYGDDVLYGTYLNNLLEGEEHNDFLYGQFGNDTLNGGSGDNILIGGEGDDKLFLNANDIALGGGGHDTFAINTATNHTVTLLDFDINHDHIDFYLNKHFAYLENHHLAQRLDSQGVLDAKFNYAAFIVNDETKEMSVELYRFEQGNNRGPLTINLGQQNRSINDFKQFLDPILEPDSSYVLDYSKSTIGINSLYHSDQETDFVGSNFDDKILADVDVNGMDGEDEIHLVKDNMEIEGGRGGDTFVLYKNVTGTTILDFNPEEDTIDLAGIGQLSDVAFEQLTDTELKLIISASGTEVTFKSRQPLSYRNILESSGGNIIEPVYLSGEQVRLTFNGNARHNVLISGTENDDLSGKWGEDFIDGNGGDDTLEGGVGLDTLVGGSGHDVLYGDHKSKYGGDLDHIYGGEGNDTAYGANGNDKLWGNAGNDHLNGGVDHDELYGGTGADTLVGETGYDYLHGGAGNDHLLGGAQHDLLSGGAGNDKLDGGSGNDTLYDGAGVDTLTGGDGEDIFCLTKKTGEAYDYITDFNAEKDRLVVTVDNHDVTHKSIQTKTGTLLEFSDDRRLFLLGVYANQVESRLSKILEHENTQYQYLELKSAEPVPEAPQFGSDYSEKLVGTDGNDALYGLAGHDELWGGKGNDTLHGTFLSNRIEGDEGNDYLYGHYGNDTLNGWSGNNVLDGGEGDDLIIMNGRYETAIGGAGRDTFLVNYAQKKDIKLLDFNLAEDRIDFLRDEQLNHVHEVNNASHSSLNIMLDAGHNELVFNVGGLTFNFGSQDLTQLAGFVDLFRPIVKGDVWVSVSYSNSKNVKNELDFGGQKIDFVIGSELNDTIRLNSVAHQFFGGKGADTYVISGDPQYRQTYDIRGFDIAADKIELAELSTYILANTHYSDRPEIVEMTQVNSHTIKLYIPLLSQTVMLHSMTDKDPNFTVENVQLTYTPTDDQRRIHHSKYDDIIFGQNDGEGRLTGGEGNDSIYAGNENNHLYGGNGNDYLKGSTGNDYIEGGNGNDQIYSENGDDFIRAEDGNDFVSAGEGNDKVFAEDGNNTLHGNAGNDTLSSGDGMDDLKGGAGNDALYGGYGGDILNGNEGDDDIDGGPGSDTLYGETGNDTLDGGENNDTLYGHAGDDLLYGGHGDDYIRGREDNDTIYGGRGNDRLYGDLNDSGDDKIYGETGNDTLHGGAGNDILDGGYGHDAVYGGAGNDSLRGGADNDTLNGDVGDDYINADSGNDKAYGGLGNDNIQGGFGDDTLYGQEDHDYLKGDDGDDHLNGGAGNDRVYGNDGNDSLYGNVGNDSLSGNDGNDRLEGQAGNDYLYGQAGNDALFGGDGNDQIYGNEGADYLSGGAGTDKLVGGDGNDTLAGNEEFDRIFAGTGADKVYGGTGDDYIEGGAGDDTLYGQEDKDYIKGDAGNDHINGGYGDDQIYGNDGNDSLYGNTGSDKLNGDAGDDLINGQDGNDYLYAGAGKDVVYGEAGNDTVYGHEGDDLIFGGEGDDYIRGRQDNDTIYGGAGNDRLYGDMQDAGDDKIYGEAGNDNIHGGAGNDFLSGGSGVDYIYASLGDDTVYGGTGNDRLNGDAGNDTVYGDAGNDTLYGHTGDDVLSGGDGNDHIRGREDNDIIHGDTGNDTLYGDAGNDSAYGGIGNDTVYGGAGNDTLSGGDGNDYMEGHAGADTLTGGRGGDILYGGSGADVFVFEAYTDSTMQNTDLIVDFEQGEDLIDLSQTGVTALSNFAISYTGSGSTAMTILEHQDEDMAFRFKGEFELSHDDFVF